MTRVLMLGAGSSRDQRISVRGRTTFDGCEVVTIDHEPSHKTGVVHDLNEIPWPFEDDSFDEVHAYEILEHLGQQGDAMSFFGTFDEIWRVLKPGGVLAATVPNWQSVWAWGDPSHRRVINHGSLVFLDRTEYARQIGVTAMSDFRSTFVSDFERVKGCLHYSDTTFSFALVAHKPARC